MLPYLVCLSAKLHLFELDKNNHKPIESSIFLPQVRTTPVRSGQSGGIANEPDQRREAAASPISRSADAAPNHEGEYKPGVDTVDEGSKEEKATTGELEDFKIDLNTKTAVRTMKLLALRPCRSNKNPRILILSVFDSNNTFRTCPRLASTSSTIGSSTRVQGRKKILHLPRKSPSIPTAVLHDSNHLERPKIVYHFSDTLMNAAFLRHF